jgi:hypothetical protein
LSAPAARRQIGPQDPGEIAPTATLAISRPPCDDGRVAEVRQLDGERIWFTDPRGSSRGLAVTAHPEAGVLVLSHWSGDTCTGSFRLPMDDVPRLIAALGYALGESSGHDGDTSLTAS